MSNAFLAACVGPSPPVSGRATSKASPNGTMTTRHVGVGTRVRRICVELR